MSTTVSANGARVLPKLLDDTSDIEYAYSLRKLRKAFSGPCIRVRRSSDNAETDIGFYRNQLDETTLLTHVGAGNDGFVTTWYSQIAGKPNCIQTDPLQQPRIVVAGAVQRDSIGKAAVSYKDTFGVTENPNLGSAVLTDTNTYALNGYELRQSSVYISPENYIVPKAFDKTGGYISNLWHSATGTNWAGGGTQWISIQYPSAVRVTHYSITAREIDLSNAGFPTAFQFQGSNDNATWTTLDTRSGLSWTLGQTQAFTPTTTGSYLYYRLLVTLTANTWVVIGEWRLFCLDENPNLGSATVESATRVSLNGYIGTASSTYTNEGRYIRQAFNKTNANTDDGWHSAGPAAPWWLQIGYPTPVTVTTYSIQNRTSFQHIPTTWELRASNSLNNSGYIVVDSRSGISWAAGSLVKTYAVTSPGSYQYYRLHITAGTSTAFVFIGEWRLYTTPLTKLVSIDATPATRYDVLPSLSAAPSATTSSGAVLPVAELVGAATLARASAVWTAQRKAYTPSSQTALASKVTFGAPAVLDTLSATTKASCQCAFSLRRLTRTLYTGPVVRLRRGSDNLERDFWGLDTDAAVITDFLQGTTGYVKTLYDQSGKGNHATQTTTGNQPQYIASTSWSAKPGFSFDGTDDFLPFNGGGIVNTEYSVITAVARTSGKNFNVYIGGTESVSNKNLHIGWRSNTSITHAQYTYGYDTTVPGYSAPSMEVHTARARGSIPGKNFYRNGVLFGTDVDTQQLLDWQGASLGRITYAGTTTSYFQGHITESILFSSYLDDTDRSSLETTTMSRYVTPSTQVPRTLKVSRMTSLHSSRLLDLLPAQSAACAFSVSRKLRAIYAGPCLRLRNASGVEQDIYFTSKWELDQLSVLAHCGTGDGFVSVLYDQSGNGRHATQTTQPNQPTLVVSGTIQTQNGKPAMVFSGGQNLFFDGTPLANSNYTALITVARANSNRMFPFGGTALVANGNFALAFDTSTTVHHVQFQNFYSAVIPAFGSQIHQLFRLRHSTTLGKNVSLNGNQIGTSADTTSLVGWAGAALGSRTDGDGLQFFTGKMAEALFATSYISDSDCQSLDTDTMTYYGIA